MPRYTRFSELDEASKRAFVEEEDSLPYYTSLPRETRSFKPEFRHPSLRLGALSGLDVLVAENEPRTRERLARLLKINGAKVRAAENGVTALQKIYDISPHVLVIDVSLPGPSTSQNGIEVIRTLRRDGPVGIKIIGLSLEQHPSDEARAKAAGVECLWKPSMRINQVVKWVEKFAVKPSRAIRRIR